MAIVTYGQDGWGPALFATATECLLYEISIEECNGFFYVFFLFCCCLSRSYLMYFFPSPIRIHIYMDILNFKFFDADKQQKKCFRRASSDQFDLAAEIRRSL